MSVGCDHRLPQLLQLYVAQRLGEHELRDVLSPREERPLLGFSAIDEKVEGEHRFVVEGNGNIPFNRVHASHAVELGYHQQAVVIEIQDIRNFGQEGSTIGSPESFP